MNNIFEDRGSRKADIKIRFSDFELPLMQDILLIGRRVGKPVERRGRKATGLKQWKCNDSRVA